MNTPTVLPLQISDRGSTPVSLVCPLKGCNTPHPTPPPPPPDDHVHTFSKTRSNCKYCSFLNLRSKQLHPERAPLKVSNVYRMCVRCNVHLCEAHFQVYHTKKYDSSDDEDDVVKKFESVWKNIKKNFTSAIASSLLIQLGSIRGVSKGIEDDFLHFSIANVKHVAEVLDFSPSSFSMTSTAFLVTFAPNPSPLSPGGSRKVLRTRHLG